MLLDFNYFQPINQQPPHRGYVKKKKQVSNKTTCLHRERVVKYAVMSCQVGGKARQERWCKHSVTPCLREGATALGESVPTPSAKSSTRAGS
ncbi:hypothetical protein Ppro_2178 [Pelobacter propionicus DSM 2379]|uniref:Uncharacterized protein n=1 Tax=Pelobacter propionicus (strain DSM 2379 / NBRC 103807 / OttBd1) TaxID=338966 RepID=A1AR16_PELPD|nr:hypothetical protein Ppro_2178 [Pelobacter propionicus DSM 2379]